MEGGEPGVALDVALVVEGHPAPLEQRGGAVQVLHLEHGGRPPGRHRAAVHRAMQRQPPPGHVELRPLRPFPTDQPQAQDRRRRVNDLLAILSLIDSLAQRFFESQRGLRAAVNLLAQKDE